MALTAIEERSGEVEPCDASGVRGHERRPTRFLLGVVVALLAAGLAAAASARNQDESAQSLAETAISAEAPSASTPGSGATAVPSVAPTETTLGSTVTEPSSTPSSAAPAHVEPVRFGATSGGLSFEAVVEQPAVAGDFVRLVVRVRDTSGGGFTIGVRWGDGGPQSWPGPPSVDCTAAATPANDPASEERSVEHAYRAAGRYKVDVVVHSAGCNRDPRTAETAATLPVAASSRAPSNGPGAPSVSLSQPPAGPGDEPGVAYVSYGVSDADGYVTSIAISWGDGSPVETIDYPLSGCRDSPTTYPSTGRSSSASHRYEAHGQHTVSVEIVSVGCDGRDAQRASKSLSITAVA